MFWVGENLAGGTTQTGHQPGGHEALGPGLGLNTRI